MNKEDVIELLESSLDKVTEMKKSSLELSMYLGSEVFDEVFNWAIRMEDEIIEYERRIDHGEDHEKVYHEFISNYKEPEFKIERDTALLLLKFYNIGRDNYEALC